jgi:predicted phosphodiesterase
VTLSAPAIAWLEILADEKGTVHQTIFDTADGMHRANDTIFKFQILVQNANLRFRIKAKEVITFDPYKIEYGEEIETLEYTTACYLPSGAAHQDSETLRCIVLNDIHENPTSYSDLFAISSTKNPHLLLLNGDLLHYVRDQGDLIQKFLQPLSSTLHVRIPFLLVRGNHETRGAYAKHIKTYFDFPQQRYFQSFRMGSVYFIVLDSGEDKPDDHAVYAGTTDFYSYRLQQAEWLKTVLQSDERAGASHTLVISHIPWWHSDDWHGTMHCKSSFHQNIQDAGVDAVISEHTHKYGFYKPNEDHNYYVIIGGGPKPGNRTLVEITAGNRRLRVNLRKDDGTLIGSFSRR